MLTSQDKRTLLDALDNAERVSNVGFNPRAYDIAKARKALEQGSPVLGKRLEVTLANVNTLDLASDAERNTHGAALAIARRLQQPAYLGRR